MSATEKILKNSIPVAYICEFQKKENRLLVTSKGDFLEEISLPCRLYLVLIKKSENLNQQFALSYEGFTDENLNKLYVSLYRVEVLKIKKRKKRYLVFFQSLEPLPEEITGGWLCVEKQILEKLQSFYFYHIKDKSAFDENGNHIGIITGYLETSAHGILIIQLKDEIYPDKEIFVPFVDTFCKVEYTISKKKLSKEIQKVVIKNWQYFIET